MMATIVENMVKQADLDENMRLILCLGNMATSILIAHTPKKTFKKSRFKKQRFSSKMKSGHFFDAWDQPETKN